jgi:hypothetical protein
VGELRIGGSAAHPRCSEGSYFPIECEDHFPNGDVISASIERISSGSAFLRGDDPGFLQLLENLVEIILRKTFFAREGMSGYFAIVSDTDERPEPIISLFRYFHNVD